jgi:hypothetical protein
MAMQLICAIVDCPRTVFSRGWCQKHYTRWLRHGDPDVEFRSKGSAYSRVMERTVPEGDCLRFLGCRSGVGGYGAVRVGDRMVKAHRVVIEHYLGPSDLLVLHSCDHPWCVEITHLRYGTAAENMADREERNPEYPIMNQWGGPWPRRDCA